MSRMAEAWQEQQERECESGIDDFEAWIAHLETSPKTEQPEVAKRIVPPIGTYQQPF